MSFPVLAVTARVVHLSRKLVDPARPRYLYRPPSLRLSIGLQLWPFKDDWECGSVGACPALGVTVQEAHSTWPVQRCATFYFQKILHITVRVALSTRTSKTSKSAPENMS